MEILPATPELNAAWDHLVDASPEGWPFALSGWQRLILSVADWGLQDRSAAVSQGGELLAVVPLQHQADARRVGSSGFGGCGPVVAAGVPRRLRRRVLDCAFDYVFEVCREVGARRFDMSQSPVTRAAIGNAWGVAPYLEYGLADVSTLSRVASLAVAEDILWKGLSQNARQMAQRALSLGYTVTRTDWDSQVDEYYRVHEETYRRTGVQPHPRAYFEGIAREMGPRGNAVLWVGRDAEGRSVAFHNDARMAGASMYHTGCCETAHLRSGVNYLLFWEAMRGARREGCAWYEIGEVFPCPGTEKERGLTVFKSKFGGEDHRSFKWVREWADSKECGAPPDSDGDHCASAPASVAGTPAEPYTRAAFRRFLGRLGRRVTGILQAVARAGR
jgi:hypothetical protein